MAKKGGASMLVETILLIGFVVISTIGVYSFMKEKAETDTKKTIEGIASNLECADVKIDSSCDEDNTIINNTGFFAIKNLLIRTSTEEPVILDINMLPKDSIDEISNPKLLLTLNIEYEVAPLVNANNKLYICKGKSIKITKCQ